MGIGILLANFFCASTIYFMSNFVKICSKIILILNLGRGEDLYKNSKFFSILISIVLLLNITGTKTYSADSSVGDYQEINFLPIQLVNNVSIQEPNIDNSHQLGALKAGQVLYSDITKLNNGNFIVKWNEVLVEINIKDAVELVGEKIDLPEIHNEARLTEKSVVLLEDMILYEDSLLTQEAGSLSRSDNPYLVTVHEDVLEVILGNRSFYLMNDNQIIEFEEEQKTEIEFPVDSVEENNQAESKVEIQSTEEKTVTSDQSTVTSLSSSSLGPTLNFQDFFEVTGDNVPVIMNNNNGHINKLFLIKGQVFKRVRDYGNWHEVLIGGERAYIWKSNTKPVAQPTTVFRNEILSYGTVTMKDEAVAYDTSSGEKVPIATLLNSDFYLYENYYAYENWVAINIFGRVVFINKSNVKFNFYSDDKYFNVINETVPVLINTSSGPRELVYLQKGQTYERVKDYGNWHRVLIGDQEGFVWKEYTEPGTSFNSVKENSNQISVHTITNSDLYDTSTGQRIKIGTVLGNNELLIVGNYEDYANWVKVNALGKVGYINKSALKVREFNNEDSYFYVSDGPLPIYTSGPNGSTIEGYLNEGEVFKRLGMDGNWHVVEIGNKKGYVWASATYPTTSANIQNEANLKQISSKTFTVNVSAPVIDTSDNSRKTMGVLEKGTQYPIVEEYENWYKVIFMGRIGFVNKNGTTREFYITDSYFEVVHDDTPVYVNGNQGSIAATLLKKGQTYKRLGDSGNWHVIEIGGITGYVFKGATIPSYKKYITNPVTMKNLDHKTIKVKSNAGIYDISMGDRILFAEANQTELNFQILEEFENWVKIDVLGREGYINKSNIEVKVLSVDIVNPLREYTYEDMVKDIDSLVKTYPSLISQQIIGKSIDGRNIYAVKLGKGKTETFINGSHHAREHLTTNLLMEMIDQYAQSYTKNQMFDGYNVKSLLDQTTIWFVPMVNPDGVTLVQKGHYSSKNPYKVLALNNFNSNFSSWKANVRGVDLNRQYPANWNTICCDPGMPGPKNHKGPYPLSEPEAKALYDFTNKMNFKIATAYHSSGEIIYWYFHQQSLEKSRDLNIANKIRTKTGYSLVSPTPNPSGGGYTDWFLQSKKRPGFTPEISPYVGERPVPVSSFRSIWDKNNSIGLLLAKEAMSY
jgi:SH3-like domain-containing protein